MTTELIRILSDFKSLIDYWNASRLMSENELVDQLKILNERLREELERKDVPEIER